MKELVEKIFDHLYELCPGALLLLSAAVWAKPGFSRLLEGHDALTAMVGLLSMYILSLVLLVYVRLLRTRFIQVGTGGQRLLLFPRFPREGPFQLLEVSRRIDQRVKRMAGYALLGPPPDDPPSEPEEWLTLLESAGLDQNSHSAFENANRLQTDIIVNYALMLSILVGVFQAVLRLVLFGVAHFLKTPFVAVWREGWISPLALAFLAAAGLWSGVQLRRHASRLWKRQLYVIDLCIGQQRARGAGADS